MVLGRKIKIAGHADRPSFLQLQKEASNFPVFERELYTVPFSSHIDTPPLSNSNGSILAEFVSAIKARKADIFIDFSKDLPYPLPAGLETFCLLDSLGDEGDPHASLLTKKWIAIVGRSGDDELKTFFLNYDIRQNWGKVTLVGFGPGNPDLLTIGGDKALRKADVIFHDDLLDKDFLDGYAGEKQYVGKRCGRHSHCQMNINELLCEAAIAGKNVVRLKGGDPMIFAHGREEFDFLSSHFVEVAVIPGVTSALALSASTHIPLTHRDVASSVVFVNGHSVEQVVKTQADTLVIYMGGGKISEIAYRLIEAGRDKQTPVALVHNVSHSSQKSFYATLDELQRSSFQYPTPILIVVGDVVAFENGNEIGVTVQQQVAHYQ